jgi:hypothetical protein
VATRAVRFPFGSVSADEDGVTISGPGGPTVLAYSEIRAVSTRFIGKELRIETAAGVRNLKLYNWFRVPAMREAIEAGVERSN